MSYECEIVADSISTVGAKLTTFRLKYPRFIHQELLTHRAFSRNASSSRAIPTAKAIEWVEKDPAFPVYWGKARKGMQAGEEVSPREVGQCKQVWLEARDRAVRYARAFANEAKIHKQIASRVLEPFAHINVVLTSCPPGLHNFFRQRCHADAQPEMCRLAVLMARAYRDSTPAPVDLGGWHLPFVTEAEADLPLADRIAVSVARCARVSYLAHDGKPASVVDDLVLAGRLLDDLHLSPFEHQATPFVDPRKRSGNFLGWDQWRQRMQPEAEPFDFATLGDFA